MSEHTILDCSECVGQERPECDDCLVRFLVERDECVLDPVEEGAIRALAAAGMLADLRHRRAG